MIKYLTEGPITPDQIAAEISNLARRKDTGGHSIFLGQVRDDHAGEKRVKAIEYSAYEEMVKDETEKIRRIIFNEFSDVLEIIILHAVGIVRAGEISMFILVSAGHRDHAVRACHQTVELVKNKLPVWKKEIFEDNTHSWQENT